MPKSVLYKISLYGPHFSEKCLSAASALHENRGPSTAHLPATNLQHETGDETLEHITHISVFIICHRTLMIQDCLRNKEQKEQEYIGEL